LTRFNTAFLLVSILFFSKADAQKVSFSKYDFIQNYSISDEARQDVFPDPQGVMRRSLILPGWGQVTNKQVWKVPIIYGLLGGLTYYSIELTKDYHDYRAAYYNATSSTADFRFGATPDYLVGANTSGVRNQRDFLRNRRDFTYVTIALAYLLNVIDAYVFAHLRPFDVSDDLSANREWVPSNIESTLFGDVPGISLKISLTR